MIIVDINQIMISNLMVTIHRDNLELSEDLVRHMVLNSLRGHNKKFRKEYGDMVIACDSGNVWRRQAFPNYKAGRKETREKSEHDWTMIFDILSKVKDEIKTFLPYKVIEVESVEADDIIAVLSDGTQEFGKDEPVMIVSADKDFLQLHRYSNVKQFSPMKRDLITVDDPLYYRFEHTCKGDSSDGVPNILSPDNTFVDGLRQKPMRVKKIQEWYESKDDLASVMDQETLRNFQRNQKVIDLSFIPKEVTDQIVEEHESQSSKRKTDYPFHLEPEHSINHCTA